MGMQLREFAAWARNRKILATLLVTVTLAVGMVIGTVISGHVGAAHPASRDRRNAAGDSRSRAAVERLCHHREQVQPAVVNISTTQVIEQHGRGRPAARNRGGEMAPPDGQDQDQDQQPFQDFFNRFFDFPDQGPHGGAQPGIGRDRR